jgi:hypothetical protein
VAPHHPDRLRVGGAVEPAARDRQNTDLGSRRCQVLRGRRVDPRGAGRLLAMMEQTADLLALRRDETSALLLVALRGDF